MPRARLLAVPLAGLALLGGGGTAHAPTAAITAAALAPYRDELLRDAPALCSDLTPSAAARIVPATPPGEGCEQAVQRVFAATAAPRLPRAAVLALRASASHLQIDGDRATGVFSLTSEVTGHERPGIVSVGIVALGNYRLDLEELAGRWVVSSPARLVAVEDCALEPPGRCRAGVEDALFSLGEPVGTFVGESLPTPAAVRHAGRREQAEFAAGRTAFARSGCLACHRLGDEGNRGPGQNLTHVGARLSSRQIEQVVLSPRAPMPAFKYLPHKQLRDLIRFLSLLR
jgi:hypothetical protein